jgi:hypothetical protein
VRVDPNSGFDAIASTIKAKDKPLVVYVSEGCAVPEAPPGGVAPKIVLREDDVKLIREQLSQAARADEKPKSLMLSHTVNPPLEDLEVSLEAMGTDELNLAAVELQARPAPLFLAAGPIHTGPTQLLVGGPISAEAAVGAAGARGLPRKHRLCCRHRCPPAAARPPLRSLTRRRSPDTAGGGARPEPGPAGLGASERRSAQARARGGRARRVE